MTTSKNSTASRLPKAEYFAQRLAQAKEIGDTKKAEYYASRLANLQDPFAIVNKVIMFGFNFNAGFIAKCWEDDSHLAEHFQSKFSNLYNRVGCRNVMFSFYTELSQNHQNKLVQYIMDTYKG